MERTLKYCEGNSKFAYGLALRDLILYTFSSFTIFCWWAYGSFTDVGFACDKVTGIVGICWNCSGVPYPSFWRTAILAHFMMCLPFKRSKMIKEIQKFMVFLITALFHPNIKLCLRWTFRIEAAIAGAFWRQEGGLRRWWNGSLLGPMLSFLGPCFGRHGMVRCQCGKLRQWFNILTRLTSCWMDATPQLQFWEV